MTTINDSTLWRSVVSLERSDPSVEDNTLWRSKRQSGGTEVEVQGVQDSSAVKPGQHSSINSLEDETLWRSAAAFDDTSSSVKDNEEKCDSSRFAESFDDIVDETLWRSKRQSGGTEVELKAVQEPSALKPVLRSSINTVEDETLWRSAAAFDVSSSSVNDLGHGNNCPNENFAESSATVDDNTLWRSKRQSGGVDVEPKTVQELSPIRPGQHSSIKILEDDTLWRSVASFDDTSSSVKENEEKCDSSRFAESLDDIVDETLWRSKRQSGGTEVEMQGVHVSMATIHEAPARPVRRSSLNTVGDETLWRSAANSDGTCSPAVDIDQRHESPNHGVLEENDFKKLSTIEENKQIFAAAERANDSVQPVEEPPAAILSPILPALRPTTDSKPIDEDVRQRSHLQDLKSLPTVTPRARRKTLKAPFFTGLTPLEDTSLSEIHSTFIDTPSRNLRPRKSLVNTSTSRPTVNETAVSQLSQGSSILDDSDFASVVPRHIILRCKPQAAAATCSSYMATKLLKSSEVDNDLSRPLRRSVRNRPSRRLVLNERPIYEFDGDGYQTLVGVAEAVTDNKLCVQYQTADIEKAMELKKKALKSRKRTRQFRQIRKKEREERALQIPEYDDEEDMDFIPE